MMFASNTFSQINAKRYTSISTSSNRKILFPAGKRIQAMFTCILLLSVAGVLGTTYAEENDEGAQLLVPESQIPEPEPKPGKGLYSCAWRIMFADSTNRIITCLIGAAFVLAMITMLGSFTCGEINQRGVMLFQDEGPSMWLRCAVVIPSLTIFLGATTHVYMVASAYQKSDNDKGYLNWRDEDTMSLSKTKPSSLKFQLAVCVVSIICGLLACYFGNGDARYALYYASWISPAVFGLVGLIFVYFRHGFILKSREEKCQEKYKDIHRVNETIFGLRDDNKNLEEKYQELFRACAKASKRKRKKDENVRILQERLDALQRKHDEAIKQHEEAEGQWEAQKTNGLRLLEEKDNLIEQKDNLIEQKDGRITNLEKWHNIDKNTEIRERKAAGGCLSPVYVSKALTVNGEHKQLRRPLGYKRTNQQQAASES